MMKHKFSLLFFLFVGLQLYCDVTFASNNAHCRFASVQYLPAIGSPSGPLEDVLGEPTVGQFDGERSWGIQRSDFHRINLVAEGVEDALLRTYDGKVFAVELIYPRDTATHWRRYVLRHLGSCAYRVAASCWLDSRGRYYILVDGSVGLLLAHGDPKLSGPSERGGPAVCRVGNGLKSSDGVKRRGK
jgi:hypothetical protein